MSDATAAVFAPAPSFGPSSLRFLASALAGLMVIVIAIQSLAYVPGAELTRQDHAVRLASFASLTIWLALAIGLRRRGSAAISVLAFASFLELFVLPLRGQPLGALPSANLGIVFAYCALRVFAWRRAARFAKGQKAVSAHLAS